MKNERFRGKHRAQRRLTTLKATFGSHSRPHSHQRTRAGTHGRRDAGTHESIADSGFSVTPCLAHRLEHFPFVRGVRLAGLSCRLQPPNFDIYLYSSYLLPLPMVWCGMARSRCVSTYSSTYTYILSWMVANYNSYKILISPKGSNHY